MFCTQCGQQNSDDSHFCARCGTPVARPTGERAVETTSTISLAPLDGGVDAGAEPDPTEHHAHEQGVLDALPVGSALLVVKRGPNAGSRFLLDQPTTTAGRHPDSDIFLDDVTVSRRHADFVREGADFLVKDVGSLNGTYLNRARIESAALSVGDEVQIGKYRLVFLASPRPGEGR